MLSHKVTNAVLDYCYPETARPIQVLQKYDYRTVAEWFDLFSGSFNEPKQLTGGEK